MRLRRRYGVYPLAVHRKNQNIGRQLDDLVVQVGDTLLLEGAAADIQRLARHGDGRHLDPVAAGLSAAPCAHGLRHVLAAVVVLAALDVAPILILALLGVAVVLLTRCIDADEAFEFVEGRLLAMIFAMLAVGAGLERSGAVGLIVDAVRPLLEGMPPFLLILAVYGLTSFLTEMCRTMRWR
jgi:di/tricarboxylate transporter